MRTLTPCCASGIVQADMGRELLGDPPQHPLERGAERVFALPGQCLLAVDSRRRHRTPGGDAYDPDTLTQDPTGALVTVAHFRGDSQPVGRLGAGGATAQAARVGHLLECVQGALELDIERVIVVVSSNEPDAVSADLAVNADRLPAGTEFRQLSDPRRLSGELEATRAVIVVGWRPSGLFLRHPFNLTWAHKPLMRAGLGAPAISHFVYLEDDVRFTQRSLSYWCEHRQPLARFGLLPGFVRVELLDDDVYVVDQLERMNCGTLPHVSLMGGAAGAEGEGEGRVRFVNLKNPYQGMYVLDRALATRHLRHSPARDAWRSRAISHWDTRARAALGPIIDDVPPGFGSRNVVPVSLEADGSCRLVPDCMIEHLAGNYSRSATDVGFGKIRLDDLFTGASA